MGARAGGSLRDTLEGIEILLARRLRTRRVHPRAPNRGVKVCPASSALKLFILGIVEMHPETPIPIMILGLPETLGKKRSCVTSNHLLGRTVPYCRSCMADPAPDCTRANMSDVTNSLPAPSQQCTHACIQTRGNVTDMHAYTLCSNFVRRLFISHMLHPYVRSFVHVPTPIHHEIPSNAPAGFSLQGLYIKVVITQPASSQGIPAVGEPFLRGRQSLAQD